MSTQEAMSRRLLSVAAPMHVTLGACCCLGPYDSKAAKTYLSGLWSMVLTRGISEEWLKRALKIHCQHFRLDAASTCKTTSNRNAISLCIHLIDRLPFLDIRNGRFIWDFDLTHVGF